MDTASETRPGGRPAGLPPGEVHEVATSDGTAVRLTRYALGGKGPIVLAPGYGNKARAFALDSVQTNFTEFLGENGYDVWLFDYRSSPALPSARTQFTVDDIATRDWPAAIDTVRRETGADSVQVLAHCVGGLSLFMALGAGLQGVRSAIFSSLAGNPIPTPANRFRAGIHLATAFKKVGISGLNTDYEDNLPDKAVDAVMHLVPFANVCDNPVCRRIAFVYGDVFDHTQLNPATHDEIAGIFGITNMTFFEHISLMIRKARALDAKGRDVYWSNIDRYKIPISFIHGEHNKMFLPKSTERTYGALVAANGPELYRRHVVKDYAHLDCWIGEHADRDVFPIALAELERHDA
jgi:choline dehydrogenase-like flavoprotein